MNLLPSLGRARLALSARRPPVAAAAGLLLAVGLVLAPSARALASTTDNSLVTLYGWDDNSPPGCAIAYPDIHSCAGGVGTFSNPITFATDSAELAPGTIVYYPPLDRYFIMEDDCAECDADWTGHGPNGGPNFRHIDLWAGGASGDNANALFACEDNWTSNGQVPVIVNPPSNEPVADGGHGGPVFVASSSHCWQPSDNGGPVVPGSGGTTIVGNHSGLCLGVTGNSTALKATADIGTCNGNGTQNWTVSSSGTIVDGSGLCLSVTGGSTTPKATADVYTCNGSVSEKWTVNSGGTIVGNNSGLCLSVTGGSTSPGATADIFTCNGSASESWTVG